MPSRRTWLRRLLLVAAAGRGLAISASTAAEELEPWTGGAAPALRLRALTGEELDITARRGSALLVNFWATWCAPCVAELPSLQRLRDRLAARGVEVIGVNVQENPARIKPFVDRLGVTFPIVRDHDGSTRAAWRVSVLPTTFALGSDLSIVWLAQGEIDWDAPAIEARIPVPAEGRPVHRT